MTTLRRVLEADPDNPVVGDLYLDQGGQLKFIGEDESSRRLEVVQHVRDRLRSFLGDWFLDARVGFPYYRDVLVKNPDRQSIISALRRTVLQTPGVGQVDELTLSSDDERRAFVSLRGLLEDGTVLEFDRFILAEF